MHIRQATIRNIKAIEEFTLNFDLGREAGWHVILGANGSGKSSVVRSIALALAGPKEAAALRQNWNTWQRRVSINSHGSASGRAIQRDEWAEPGRIEMEIISGTNDKVTGSGARPKSIAYAIDFEAITNSTGSVKWELVARDGKPAAERSLWSTNIGWFSASFGPFRRLTGGSLEFDRLYFSNPRLAGHLTAFGEDVALTEGFRWLRELRIEQLEKSKGSGDLLASLLKFLNKSQLLPHGTQIGRIRGNERIVLKGPNGVVVAIEQMSDGYRSVLSMMFEILRQLAKTYGTEALIKALDVDTKTVNLSGVILIDEVDAHLHPTWQREIGPWFTKSFPNIQFIVTTHSPIICRSATSVWHLPEPGSTDRGYRVEGVALQRLIHGSILDAYGTEFFGRDVARSIDSQELLSELAILNRKSLKTPLTKEEAVRMSELRSMLPTDASNLNPSTSTTSKPHFHRKA